MNSTCSLICWLRLGGRIKDVQISSLSSLSFSLPLSPSPLSLTLSPSPTPPHLPPSLYPSFSALRIEGPYNTAYHVPVVACDDPMIGDNPEQMLVVDTRGMVDKLEQHTTPSSPPPPLPLISSSTPLPSRLRSCVTLPTTWRRSCLTTPSWTTTPSRCCWWT